MEVVAKFLLLPSTLIMLSASIGLLLLGLPFSRKWGKGFCIVALAGYLIFGSGPVAFWLLGNLEYQISPATAGERVGIHAVVVLAAYGEPDDNIPLSSRVSSGTAFRLIETISLFQSAPDSTVVVSGGGDVPIIMRDVLVSSGIPFSKIVVDDESANTFESAVHLSSILGTREFLLVTSAGHMPRAMGVFRKTGANPRAVPTHYMAKRNWLAIQYLPSPAHLVFSDLALSEYAALLWYSIRGWI